MKARKIVTGILATFMTVVMVCTAVPVYAYVSDTKSVSGYGILKGWQEDLYEQDYNEICWVDMKTTLSNWGSGMRTALNYQPVDTATGVSLDSETSVSRYASSCSGVCYISDYGYYEDTGDVTLFSSHWTDGNGVSEIIYLRDVY